MNPTTESVSLRAPAPDPRRVAPPEEESVLLERLRARDEAAFELLVRRHAGRLLAVARHLLGCEEDARDVVQEAFLSAFRSLERFRGDSSLSTWLHRIAINASLMKLRAAARCPETPIEDFLPRFDGQGRLTSPAGPWPAGAERGVLRREVRQRVRDAIDRLPEKHRTVLVLRDIEELSTEETARVLSLTSTAVKVRLHRARLALRTLLEPLFAEHAGRQALEA
jgi:RNA polymerase sigma-70 factor (ECF subfamily)